MSLKSAQLRLVDSSRAKETEEAQLHARGLRERPRGELQPMSKFMSWCPEYLGNHFLDAGGWERLVMSD